MAGEPSAWRLDAAYTLSKVAISNSARLRTPPDAGMKPMQLPQNHENENGFVKLKPSPATDATQHLGGSEARDERSRPAQSRAYK